MGEITAGSIYQSPDSAMNALDAAPTGSKIVTRLKTAPVGRERYTKISEFRWKPDAGPAVSGYMVCDRSFYVEFEEVP